MGQHIRDWHSIPRQMYDDCDTCNFMCWRIAEAVQELTSFATCWWFRRLCISISRSICLRVILVRVHLAHTFRATALPDGECRAWYTAELQPSPTFLSSLKSTNALQTTHRRPQPQVRCSFVQISSGKISLRCTRGRLAHHDAPERSSFGHVGETLRFFGHLQRSEITYSPNLCRLHHLLVAWKVTVCHD